MSGAEEGIIGSTAHVHPALGAGGEIVCAVIRLAAVKVGQGVTTALVQIADQALDVPVRRVHVAFVNALTSPNAGQCSASRHTYMLGNAVYLACQQALAKRESPLRARTGQASGEVSYTYHGRSRRPTTNWDPLTGECDPRLSCGYGAQVALVEVLELWAANNVGKAVDPAMV